MGVSHPLPLVAENVATRMRLLDLFCGAGGAAMGYHQAGFDEIVGVDIQPQPNYPFTFIQADALAPPVRLENFDLIHASPPCQAYSTALRHRSTGDYPKLIEQTRRLIETQPYVIENVQGAPLPSAFNLCGSAFGLPFWRHRRFETSWFMFAPPCVHDKPPLNPYNSKSRIRDGLRFGSMRAYGDAMGLDWMQTTREITEAIPAAYTKFIGEAFVTHGSISRAVTDLLSDL